MRADWCKCVAAYDSTALPYLHNSCFNLSYLCSVWLILSLLLFISWKVTETEEVCFCSCAWFHGGKVQQSRSGDSFEEKPDGSSKGSAEDIRSFLGEDSAPIWRYDQIKKECGKVMLSHFGTVVNCARLGSQSPQCSELCSMFGSQSSLALLLWWRALVKRISGDGSVIFR